MPPRKNGQRTKYSASEELVMAALFEKQHKTSELLKLYYVKKSPKYARQAMTYMMRILAEKIRENREDFKLRSSVRAGPHEMSFWIEKKP